MANENRILIDVEVNASESAERLAVIRAEIDKLTAENKKMRAEQKEANRVLAEGGKLTKEQADAFAKNAEQMATNSAKLKELQAAEKMETAQVQIATQNDRKFGDSLREMGAQLTQLKNEYRGLTAAQRESAAGQDMLKQIQNLDQTMKDADATMGDFQRNVGHYQNALLGLNGNVKMVADLFAGGFKNGLAAATTALKQFGKMLLTTPVGWIAAAVGALVAVFNKLKEGFRLNDEASTRLQASLDRLRPVLDFITRGFVSLANVASKVVDVVTRFGAAVLSVIPGFKAASQAAEEHTKAVDALEETERQYTVASAQRAKERAELEDEAKNSMNLSTEERIEKMRQALELERQDMEERKNIAYQKWQNAKAEAERIGDTSDATMNRIAELQAAYISTETEYIEGTRRVRRSLKSFTDELNREEENERKERQRRAQEAARAAQQRRKEEEQRQKEAAAKELEAMRALEDAKIKMIEDETERQREETRVGYERQIADLQKRIDTEENLTETAKKSMNEQLVILQSQMWEELARIDEEGLKNNAEAMRVMEEEAKKRYDEAVAAAKGQRKGEYEQQQLQLENEFQERLNTLFGNAAAIAQAEQEQAESNYNALLNMDEATKNALYENEDQYKEAVLQAENQMMNAREKSSEALQNQAKEVGSTMHAVTGALSSLFEAAAGDSEEYEKFKKAMAIVDATISLATTIASATAASTAGEPYTMAIRIATNVAAVTAQFASVIAAIKSATVPSAGSYATGGIVPGDSYTGDKMTANVNSREMILTLGQQSKLWDMIQSGAPSFGVDYRRLRDAMADAVEGMPAPVLDYAEFTAFSRRVAMEDRKVAQL